MDFSETDRYRSLSPKTGYLFYLYQRLKNIEQELNLVMHFMHEYKPWFDSDETHPLLPNSPDKKHD